MDLLESSRRLGALRAFELSCFRRLGELAPRLEPASCARWASSASLAHAWRASLLEGLLPVSAGLPGLSELTVCREGELVELLERVMPVRVGTDPLDGREIAGEVLGELYPRLLREYAGVLERCEPASDGAVARSVRRAMADLEVIRAEGLAS